MGVNPGTDRGEPLSVTAPDGNVTGATGGYTTWYQYNAAGQTTAEYLPVSTPTNPTPPASTNHPGYIMETFQYDNGANTLGFLTSTTDGNLNTTSYVNNALGEVLQETQPAPGPSNPSLAAPVTNSLYDADGNLLATTLTTANPQETTSTVYDSLGRVLRKINPDGTYTADEYDAAGNLIYATDAMGRVTQYVYNSRRECIATIDPDGTVVRTVYDGGGRVVATVDANGNKTSYAYDPLGRQIEEIQPDPDTVAPAPATVTTVTTYVDSSDKTYVTNAEGAAQALTDGATAANLSTYIADHLVNFIDYTTETDCDTLGRTIEVIQPAPAAGQARPTTYYHYDADGNLDGVEDARGAAPTELANLATFDSTHTTYYYYDESGRKIIEQDNPGGSLGYVYTWYYYDADNNLQYVVDPEAQALRGRPRGPTVRSARRSTFTTTSTEKSRRSSRIRPPVGRPRATPTARRATSVTTPAGTWSRRPIRTAT